MKIKKESHSAGALGLLQCLRKQHHLELLCKHWVNHLKKFGKIHVDPKVNVYPKTVLTQVKRKLMKIPLESCERQGAKPVLYLPAPLADGGVF